MTALALGHAAVAHAQDVGSGGETTATGQTAVTDPEAQRTAIARAFFEEGIALGDHGRWADAADRFRRADAVRSSPPIRFNLAQSLGRLGRIVAAIEILRGVEADALAAVDVQASAAQLRARLERRLGRLTIEVVDMPEGAQIELDEVTLPAEVAGHALPVDPGEHRVRLVEADVALDAKEVTVRAGRAARVSLSPPGAVSEGSSVLVQPWFWAAVGIVVASAVVAALIIASADDGSAGARGALVRF